MNNNSILNVLEDRIILLEAHAASSAYVMRSAFATAKELQVFAGREDLARLILERIIDLTQKGSDPVILSAHLYALELTRADSEIREAAIEVLKNEALRSDPIAGQFAGQVGARLFRFEDKVASNSYFEPDELARVFNALERKEGGK